jgi:hypothetical protein
VSISSGSSRPSLKLYRANLVCILFRQSCSRRGGIASAATEDDRTSEFLYNAAMTEKAKPDLDAVLHRTLNNACRKWGAREIRLRYLPKPSLNRWIAEALIEHHRVIEKIRTDFPAGESMWPLKWSAPRNG